MSLDDFTCNLVCWSPQTFSIKQGVSKTLCFLGFHHDNWYLNSESDPLYMRQDTRFQRGTRIFRLCGRCGSIR